MKSWADAKKALDQLKPMAAELKKLGASIKSIIPSKATPPPLPLLHEEVIDRIIKARTYFPPLSFMAEIETCCLSLLMLESKSFDPAHHELLATEFFHAFNDLIDKIPEHYLVHHDKLDSQAATTYAPSVPLYEVIQDCGATVKQLAGTLFHDDIRNADLYDKQRRRLLENENIASGISNQERYTKGNVTGSDQYKGTPEEIVHLYTRYTPFEQLLSAGLPFIIPRDRWPTHAVIIAPSEWGKSQLTGTFIREALEDPEPRAIILLDPHGDLMKEVAPKVPQERLVVIDPDVNPPDLNILDYGVLSDRAALETFKFLMSSLAGGLSPKQETCINPLFALLKKIPDATLVTLHDIITEQVRKGEPSKFAPYFQQLEPIHRSFFANLFYTGNFQETKDAMQWKLSAALGEPAFAKMFSAKKNSIDLWKFVHEKKVVLVKGGENALGKEGMRMFLLFFVGQFYAIGKRRDALPPHQRHLAQMFVDEASYVLQSPVISDIFVELRKYGCSLTVATQLWSQIAQEVRPAVLGSTGIRAVGKLGHDEATYLARDMETSTDTVKGLKAVPRSHAQWCFYIRSITDRGAVVVTAPYGALDAMPSQPSPPPTAPVKPPPPPRPPKKQEASAVSSEAPSPPTVAQAKPTTTPLSPRDPTKPAPGRG